MKKSVKLVAALTLTLATMLTACSGSSAKTDSTKSASKTGLVTTSTAKTGSAATAGSTTSDSNTSGATKLDLSTITGEGDKLDKILEAGVITCATSPDFAPNEFIDISSGETKYVGCDMDLAQYIADSLGVKLEIVPMKFDAIKAAVTTGQVDMAIAGLAYTEDRAKNMQLSDLFGNTDADEGQGIVILKENADKLKTADDFAGKTVLAQNGSVQFDLTTTQLPKAKCTPIADVNNGAMEIMTGQADGLTLDLAVAKVMINTHKELAISVFLFEYESKGNVIGCTKGETKLVNAINQIVKEVNDKGLYKQWKDKAVELAKSLGVEVNN
ncbi:MAG: transporter substrate-binding domain-containing protein [Lachnospiraceae bacterium]|nr:transporter substrate-binding domain-containing protein [Lachnospiraceae bacterium]